MPFHSVVTTVLKKNKKKQKKTVHPRVSHVSVPNWSAPGQWMVDATFDWLEGGWLLPPGPTCPQVARRFEKIEEEVAFFLHHRPANVPSVFQDGRGPTNQGPPSFCVSTLRRFPGRTFSFIFFFWTFVENITKQTLTCSSYKILALDGRLWSGRAVNRSKSTMTADREKMSDRRREMALRAAAARRKGPAAAPPSSFSRFFFLSLSLSLFILSLSFFLSFSFFFSLSFPFSIASLSSGHQRPQLQLPPYFILSFFFMGRLFFINFLRRFSAFYPLGWSGRVGFSVPFLLNVGCPRAFTGFRSMASRFIFFSDIRATRCLSSFEINNIFFGGKGPMVAVPDRHGNAASIRITKHPVKPSKTQ